MTGRSFQDGTVPADRDVVWLTPPGILAALGPFDLDPCAAPDPRPWDTAAKHYTLPDDGLSLPWAGRVWCNPPYGGETWAWLERLADHGNGIALTFARTETRGFHAQVWSRAHAVLFFQGRLRFHKRDGEQAGTANAPSCLIAYGRENQAALAACVLPGAVVALR